MTTDESMQDTTSDTLKESSLTDSTSKYDSFTDEEDNGILEFMTVDEAIEMYRKIAKDGLPQLDWEFYGRRKPNENSESESRNIQFTATDVVSSEEQQEVEIDKTTLDNSEFDFDESFSELQAETSAISESLQLKKRSEPGSERKTNLSDIMSDILKETSYTEDE